jgi:hypothetical protein
MSASSSARHELAGAKKAPRREGRRGAAARLGWGANKRTEPTKHAWRGVVPFLRLFFKNFSRLENPLKALPNFGSYSVSCCWSAGIGSLSLFRHGRA